MLLPVAGFLVFSPETSNSDHSQRQGTGLKGLWYNLACHFCIPKYTEKIFPLNFFQAVKELLAKWVEKPKTDRTKMWFVDNVPLKPMSANLKSVHHILVEQC